MLHVKSTHDLMQCSALNACNALSCLMLIWLTDFRVSPLVGELDELIATRAMTEAD